MYLFKPMSQGQHVRRSSFSHNMCLIMWQIVIVNISVKACFGDLTNKHHNKGLTQIVCQILGGVRFLYFFDVPTLSYFHLMRNKHHNKGLTQKVCQILGGVRFLNFFDFPIPFHSLATYMMTL